MIARAGTGQPVNLVDSSGSKAEGGKTEKSRVPGSARVARYASPLVGVIT